MWGHGSGASMTALVLVLGAGAAGAQVPGTLQEFGAPVYPAYEGWYESPDGTITLLAGYFNANTAEIVDVPVGSDNYLEPGPPDQGQPTHFVPGRAWGVFTIRIPGDSPDHRVVWHLTANGETVSIPMHLDPQWIIEPFEDAANGNKPPVVRFASGVVPFVVELRVANSRSPLRSHLCYATSATTPSGGASASRAPTRCCRSR